MHEPAQPFLQTLVLLPLLNSLTQIVHVKSYKWLTVLYKREQIKNIGYFT